MSKTTKIIIVVVAVGATVYGIYVWMKKKKAAEAEATKTV